MSNKKELRHRFMLVEGKEPGFSLIELLVAILVLGILAAVAIPIYLNQRQAAQRSTAVSDVRNAAIEVESYLTLEGDYPDAAAFATLGVRESENVSLSYTLLPGALAYRIDADHASLGVGVDARYCSLDGGLQTDPATTCSTG